jgi:hypothetical protein
VKIILKLIVTLIALFASAVGRAAPVECDIDVASLVDYGDVIRSKDVIVLVSKNICVDTSTFPLFQISDIKNWKIDAAERDNEAKITKFRITPLVKGVETSMYLEGSNDKVFRLTLKSVH